MSLAPGTTPPPRPGCRPPSPRYYPVMVGWGSSDALLPVGLGCCGRRWVTAPSVHQRTHPLSAYTPLSAIRWQHRGFAMLSLW